MDELDRKILSELQRDGRATITELAKRVGLSVSPCHRRLRALEQSGAIIGYRAELDPVAIGLGFESLVFATLHDSNHRTISSFETSVEQVPNIVRAQRLFGEPDYLLRVIAEDLAGFQRLYDETLSGLPGVLRLTSTLVMKTIVDNRPFPT